MSIVDATSYTNQFQLLIDPPKSTSGASIQTIQQNQGYSQNLLSQKNGGNVGIGTTNPTCKFTVQGVANINNG